RGEHQERAAVALLELVARECPRVDAELANRHAASAVQLCAIRKRPHASVLAPCLGGPGGALEDRRHEPPAPCGNARAGRTHGRRGSHERRSEPRIARSSPSKGPSAGPDTPRGVVRLGPWARISTRNRPRGRG